MGDGESEIMDKPFHICLSVCQYTGRFEACDNRQTYHKRSREDETEVEQLGGQLPRILETGKHSGQSVGRSEDAAM